MYFKFFFYSFENVASFEKIFKVHRERHKYYILPVSIQYVTDRSGWIHDKLDLFWGREDLK